MADWLLSFAGCMATLDMPGGSVRTHFYDWQLAFLASPHSLQGLLFKEPSYDVLTRQHKFHDGNSGSGHFSPCLISETPDMTHVQILWLGNGL